MIVRSFTAFIVAAILQLLAAGSAWAQLAPTGPHYAGRATDTGHSSVSRTGAYSTAVALDLPPARGGLPVPLAVVHGGRGVGAAGLGWDIPLSFVRRDTTIAHRRPSFSVTTAITGREQVTLSLAGRTLLMVRDGDVWRARQDAPDVALYERPDGRWQAYDGSGNEYTFIIPCLISGHCLTGFDFWVLSRVSSTVQKNHVELKYEAASISGTGWNGVSIDLIAVRYNEHPSDPECTKADISLTYGTPAAQPISVSFLETLPIVRTRTLSSIDVRQRAACGAAAETVRSYHFAYQSDRDTGLPRLQTVQLAGRQSTPEALTRITQGEYAYGSATRSVRGNIQLEYVRGADIVLPADLESETISSSYRDATVPSPVGSISNASWQNLIDLTGDGRPDLVYRKNDQLWLATNRPAGGVVSSLTATAPVQLSATPFLGKPLFSNSSTSPRYDYQWTNQEDIWRQTIDINGDGRLDVIDATEAPGMWFVYLNTPGNPVTWIRRGIRVTDVRTALQGKGHAFANDFVPLARRTSGRDTMGSECWHWDGDSYELDPSGLVPPSGGCVGQGTIIPQQYADGAQEKTFTEWELRDLNGDGYPDLAFNSSPVHHTSNPPFTYTQPYVLFTSPHQILKPELGAGNTINALINVAGVRFDDSAIFAPPLAPFHAGLPEDAECGVARWTDYESPDEQVLGCGLEDVNGDGLVDRILGTTAWLGTGASVDASGFSVQLPGLIRHANPRDTTCAGTAAPYYPTQIAGLRDLTGDGRPDFISRNGAAWQVAIGSGTSFSAPVPIQLPAGNGDFETSKVHEDCIGGFSNTIGGLYDVDGDGKPEVVRLAHSPTRLEVFHPMGSEIGNPGAGRLERISDGYGATTTIRYQSAKQDTSYGHHVPFPEIVVTAIETTGGWGLGGSLSTVGYAYGDPELAFDPVADAFTMVGYRKSIEVRGTGTREDLAEVAIVTETHGLSPYQGQSDADNFERYQKAGRIRDVYVLGHDVPRDPWVALGSLTTSDTRRIAGRHSEWRSRYTPLAGPPSGNQMDCLDIPYPYDWNASFGANLGNSPCLARGFTYAQVNEAWEGTQAPPSSSNVQTRSEIVAIDDHGNVLSARNENDRVRGDDDVCIDLTYAQSTSALRILHAPATRRLTDCGPAGRERVLAMERWEYDTLPAGDVQLGRTTAHVYERHATDTGDLLATVREYEASYDGTGNPVFFASAREDGALRTTALAYDTFGLSVTQTTIDGSGVDPLVTSIGRDPVTLDSLTTSETGGPVWSRILDGYGRETRTVVEPVGGSYGVVSTTDYLGFTDGDPLGRRIHHLALNTPTPPESIGSAPRQESTVFLDELGRMRRTERNLGASYTGATLITSFLTYDGLGRVAFSADAFPSSQSADTTYGTSYHYMPDGTIKCAVRGNGPQPLTQSSNAASELFPTCVTRTYVNNQLRTEVQGPDALLAGSPQAGVRNVSLSSAIGWTLSTETTQGASRLELDSRYYDRLGQLTSLTRFKTPATAVDRVNWSWRFDNLGQQLAVTEPATATRSFSYSNFGELVATAWNDGGSSVSVAAAYDAFSRTTNRADLVNGATVSGTAYQWKYDQATGRLASTQSALGDIAFGYDGLGRPHARTYTNHRTGAQYTETSTYNLHGQLDSVEFRLPDNGNTPEIFTYGYDSAGRLTTINAKATPSYPAATLYHASSIDVFGRALSAAYGDNTTYSAVHNNTGRRLPATEQIQIASGAIRGIAYLGFDPLGRELQREERRPDGTNAVSTSAYDKLGNLGQVVASSISGNVTDAFTYDPLGNRITASSNGTVNVQTDAQDYDRVCQISYGGAWGQSCTVQYDAVGNIKQMPTSGGNLRTLSFYPSGLVQRLDTRFGWLLRSAWFAYDGTGAISEITSNIGIAVDRRFGLIQERSTSSATALALVRHIPGPGGIVATSAGKYGDWVYKFDEQRGNRFTANDQSGFLQDVDYSPFGIASASGTSTSDPKYTRDQWNGGTALESFGVVQLGARIYDPRLGRFLSRDPLIVPRTAAKMNPYAFALNDPINFSDPTGLDSSCDASSGTCSGSQSSWGALLAGLGSLLDGGGQGSAPSTVPKQDTSSIGGFTAAQFIHPDNFRVGTSGVRLRADVPRTDYVNHKALDMAGYGHYRLAEVAEAGHACFFCHWVKSFGSLKEANDALDLRKYNRLAVGLGFARQGMEIGLAASGSLEIGGALRSGFRAPVTTVYRVEGSVNQRLVIDAAGNVSIQGRKMLFLNFGDAARAEQFLSTRVAQGMEGATVRSFQVPTSFVDELAASAVPESLARQVPNAPLVVDVTKGLNQFGLRPAQIEALERVIIPGSGR